jgi:hypothetical protein
MAILNQQRKQPSHFADSCKLPERHTRDDDKRIVSGATPPGSEAKGLTPAGVLAVQQ